MAGVGPVAGGLPLAAGGGAAPVTLGIPEPQLLLHEPTDPWGYIWHHRIALCRAGGARWVTLTPDLELDVVDLSARRHRVLDRARGFPRDVQALVYAHDPLTRGEIDAYKRQAQMQAALLDGDAMVAQEEESWVIWETDRADFGEKVDDDEVVGGRYRGYVEIGGIEVAVRRFAANVVEAVNRARGADQDIRLVGDHRDAGGRRHLELRDALALYRSTPFKDWNLPGPRAVREWLSSVVDGPGNLTSYHHEWIRMSGVSETTSAAHEHRVLVEALRLGVAVDQFDVTNSAMVEQLVRRLIQVEVAVGRNSRFPDFSGLDVVMSAPTTASGAAELPVFKGARRRIRSSGLGFRSWELHLSSSSSPSSSSSSSSSLLLMRFISFLYCVCLYYNIIIIL